MQIVATSDTHSRHEQLTVPDGDVFVHAGDSMKFGSLDELDNFNRWLGTLPHAHKIVIAGNHDWCFQTMPEDAQARLTNATYLQDESVTIDGVHFYGSPWQPWFLDWAFNLQRGPEIKEKWDLIPAACDVLITHGPPHGILDETVRGESVGCEELLLALERVQPKLHIFGHIHEAAGLQEIGATTFANASFLDVRYKAAQECTVLSI
ncbi:MAG: metallophosphatase domain-containing protein [Planctomycetota bacterium]|nr:metallophosphatase domain-containing protein [Planctomycetota bacterium]